MQNVLLLHNSTSQWTAEPKHWGIVVLQNNGHQEVVTSIQFVKIKAKVWHDSLDSNPAGPSHVFSLML